MGKSKHIDTKEPYSLIKQQSDLKLRMEVISLNYCDSEGSIFPV